MDTIFIIIKICAICLISYFCLPVGLMQIINNISFTSPYSQELVRNGIYDKNAHKKIMTTRWAGTILITAVFTAIDVLLIRVSMPIGLFTAILCVIIGVIVRRKFFTAKMDNVRRFTRSYLIYMDETKYNEFLSKKYDTSIKNL